MDNSITVHDVTNQVPSREIRERFGVKDRSIRLVRERGVFPASWYVGMRELCERHGIAFSDEWFNWKRPENGEDNTNAIKYGSDGAASQAPTGDAA